MGVVVPLFYKMEGQDVERLRRGGCYEREEQRAKGKQEGAADDPQREEKAEEGEEKQVGRMGRDAETRRAFRILHYRNPIFLTERM
jgi:hypothetical protein